MDYLQNFILGFVQGATELLPISSTGHLVLVSRFFKDTISSFSLTTLHLGTTVAIAVFYRDILFKNLFSKEKASLYSKILLASIPAAFVGFLLNDFIENSLRSPLIIAYSLLVVGIVMIIIENIKIKPKVKTIGEISFIQSIIIGLGQMFALIPGTSRSGITSITGVLSGLEKYTAFQFSFLMGLPVLLGSFLYEFVKSENSVEIITRPETILSILISGIVGYLSLILLKKFSKKKFLTFFGVYRVLLGIFILCM